MILYSKPFVEKIEKAVLKKTWRMKTPPVLAVVLIGNDPASISYIKRKELTAKKLGCEAKLFHLSADTNETEIIALIKKLNADKKISGMIVQLPLSAKFNTEKIISAIRKNKDVDNLRGDSPFISPAVQAIWQMIRASGNPRTQRAEPRLGKSLAGLLFVSQSLCSWTNREQSSYDGKISKKSPVLIIGYGRVIGQPIHMFLLKKKFTNIKIADIKTKNLSRLTEKADVIISGAGKANLIKDVKKDAIVIDAGASLHKGKIVGDVDLKRVAKKAKILTPVPGGVGPLTVAYLFKNLVLSAI